MTPKRRGILIEHLPFVQKFRWKIFVKRYWYFFGTENRNGIELYHLQNTGKFVSFSFLFPEDFHRDEPFYLNSPRNFRVFRTNDKRSLLCPLRRKGYLLEASVNHLKDMKVQGNLSLRWGKGPGGGVGALGISGWACAAGTLEPLTYTRASSTEFCHPILELTPQIPPILK